MPSPNDSNFTPNAVWASAPREGETHELTLPSGQTCLARKVSIQSMIETGLMGYVDSLTASVEQYTRRIKGGKGVPDGTPEIDSAILKDPQALKVLIQVADLVTPHIVASPTVLLHFTEQVVGKTRATKMIPASERIEGQIYTDQIDIEDKMFLFDWGLGGIAALQSFRGEPGGDVGGVDAGQKPRGKAKRRSGRN
jgi:hypothetical protein